MASNSRSGWVQFASIVMFAVGFIRIITAISYFSKSHKINNLSYGLFGGQVWAWGLWDLIIAALALYAGYSLMNNGSFGRVVGYIWGILVIVNSFLMEEMERYKSLVSSGFLRGKLSLFDLP